MNHYKYSFTSSTSCRILKIASLNIFAAYGVVFNIYDIDIAKAILTKITLSLDRSTTKGINLLLNCYNLYKFLIMKAKVYLWMHLSLKAYPFRDYKAIY